MMKLTRFILTGVLIVTMTSASFAASTVEDTTATKKAVPNNAAMSLTETEADQDKKEVKLTALPPAVTEALKSEKYVSWKAEKAYEVKEDGEVYYEIIVKKGAEQTSLYFNEDGVAIEK